MANNKVIETQLKLAIEEKWLAKELKALCDAQGKEKLPEKSGKIIHKLASVYRRRSPDKISLIRSAILFRAALARKIDNAKEVEADLCELGAHVLQLAGAEDQNVDLIEEARAAFRKVEDMREVVDEAVKTIHAIPENMFGDEYLKQVDQNVKIMEHVQDYIYHCFTGIMSDLMEFSVKVKGNVPCKYVLAGMGSLVTKEITPYSDFESFIVLEEGVQSRTDYEEVLEYFRWVATIFQLVLVNFGETVIYDAAISSLNHPENKEDNWFHDAFTPCGISPDGFYPHASHNPLGRQDFTKLKPWKTELIKPVSEMLKYLNEDEDRRNGYHLADILTKSCFVSGDRDLYQLFDTSVKDKLAKKGISDNVIQLLKEDQQRFGVTKALRCLQCNDQFNLKRVIYRTVTMSVSALGQMYNIDWLSSFETVDKLVNLLPYTFRINIKYAVAIACQMRLKTYLENKGQVDYQKAGKYANAEYMSTLVDFLGARGACNFLSIAFGLQEFAIKVFDQKFPCTFEQPPETLSTSQLFSTLKITIDVISAESPSLQNLIEKTNVTMRMMNYEYNKQVQLFLPETVIQYYSDRAEIMLTLEQVMTSLEYCEKSLSFDISVPFSVRIQVHFILKAICFMHFQDDAQINEFLEKLSSLTDVGILGIPVDDLYMDMWKRAIHSKKSLIVGDKNKQMSPSKKSLLRLQTLSVIEKLLRSILGSLSTDPLITLSLVSKAMNNSGENTSQQFLTAATMIDRAVEMKVDRSTEEQFNQQNKQKTGKVEERHKQQEDEDQKTLEFIEILNRTAASIGMGTMVKDCEFEKMKATRSSMVRLLGSMSRLLTLDMANDLRELKQLEENGNTQNVSTAYPTQAEFQSLAAFGLSFLKRDLNDIAAKQETLRHESSVAHYSISRKKMEFAEDDLD